MVPLSLLTATLHVTEDEHAICVVHSHFDAALSITPAQMVWFVQSN